MIIFFMIFYDNPGYLLVVLCLWSQARPWELHLAAIDGGIDPSFTTKHKTSLYKLQG
jgi:hypothetical protein